MQYFSRLLTRVAGLFPLDGIVAGFASAFAPVKMLQHFHFPCVLRNPGVNENLPLDCTATFGKPVFLF